MQVETAPAESVASDDPGLALVRAAIVANCIYRKAAERGDDAQRAEALRLIAHLRVARKYHA